MRAACVTHILSRRDQYDPSNRGHRISTPTITDECCLPDVVLIAVVLHRDLQISVNQVGTCDEVAIVVVDGVLTIGFGKSVRAQCAHKHEFALAFSRRIQRVSLSEQRTDQLRALTTALANTAK